MAGKPLDGKARMTSNLFIRFDAETDRVIRELAAKQDRPVTRVVRELVRDELKRRGLLGPQSTKRAVAVNER